MTAENESRLQHPVLPELEQRGPSARQLNTAFKREIWKDLFLAFSGYDTFDSRPPNPDAEKNDVGVVTSIGWTY
jgi:hypothetical protein